MLKKACEPHFGGALRSTLLLLTLLRDYDLIFGVMKLKFDLRSLTTLIGCVCSSFVL
jgi:hypothetical protein